MPPEPPPPPPPPPPFDPTAHLPLTAPVFQILLSLSDQSLHGYAIIQDIAARTQMEVNLTASTLYAAVRRLVDGGLIEETTSRPSAESDDPRRRYYCITDRGRDVVVAEAQRLARFADMARAKNLLGNLTPASNRKSQ
jgi:DNA-binding PadR family transcriptional regulator